VSYAHEDADIAHALIERLRGADLPVEPQEFILSPGVHILSSLRTQLAPSDYLIILLSPQILEKPWVSWEAKYAFESDLKQRAVSIIPVKIRSTRIPEYLAPWTVIDASRNQERGFEQVVALLRAAPLIDFERLQPRQFKTFVGDFLKAYGFVDVEGASVSDFGFDYTARYETKDPFGRQESQRWLIEIKTSRSQADTSLLAPFLGALSLRREGVRGLFITFGQLTSPGRKWLDQQQKGGAPRVLVLDGPELKQFTALRPRLVEKYFRASADFSK
jgi:hypothetical protein